VGRLLILVLLSLPFTSVSAVELDGLAESSNISGEKIISFVQSGMKEYSEDQVVKACVGKLDSDKRNAVYALFNYIIYLDQQKKADLITSKVARKEVRKRIKIASYAKISLNYCNR
jgi:uncharacterized pyridoxal phosphate-containing UPF0001 family protein